METQQLATSSDFIFLAYIGTAGLVVLLLVLVAGLYRHSREGALQNLATPKTRRFAVAGVLAFAVLIFAISALGLRQIRNQFSIPKNLFRLIIAFCYIKTRIESLPHRQHAFGIP